MTSKCVTQGAILDKRQRLESVAPSGEVVARAVGRTRSLPSDKLVTIGCNTRPYAIPNTESALDIVLDKVMPVLGAVAASCLEALDFNAKGRGAGCVSSRTTKGKIASAWDGGDELAAGDG